MGFLKELVAHAILIGFASYVIVSADPGSTLFSWHPTFMVLAWLLLNEGVLLFRKPSPGWRVAVHWAFQASGLILAILGVLAIYRNKEDSNKDHFVTYHGQMGIVTLILLLATGAGGNMANFSVAICRKIPLVKPKLIKSGHRVVGGLSLTAITVTVILAMFSFWFVAVTKFSLWYLLITVVSYPALYNLKATYF